MSVLRRKRSKKKTVRRKNRLTKHRKKRIEKVEKKQPSDGIAGSMMQGVVWGAMTSVGSRITDALFGPRSFTMSIPPEPEHKRCNAQFEAYSRCVREHNLDVNQCSDVLEELNRCRDFQ